MNEFLYSMEQYGEFPEEVNKRWEAQVLFFRAFIYFQLARRHDGVILYTSIEEMEKDKARSSNEATWDLIESDLDFAIANLPESWSTQDKGRLTKYAAWHSIEPCFCGRWQSAYDAATLW